MSKDLIMAASNLTNKLDKEISKLVRHSGSPTACTSKSKKKDITYSDFLSNKMLMIFVIQKGVPYSLFNLIQQFAPFTDENWAEFLDISIRSRQHNKLAYRTFKPNQSEKIIDIFEVTSMGLDVFVEREKFKIWLETPNFSLGNLKPLELLKKSYGKELVICELTNISYGILV